MVNHFLKIFIYSRKSVYTGRGESIENQIEMSKKYIFSKFTGVTDNDIIIYEDEGFSGKNIDRPAFQHMLKEIKKIKPDYVICYRLDRISRNVSNFSSLIEYLNEYNVSFICIKEEFDTSKPMGKAMMYIASVFAQLERETIAERVRDNMLMLARTGRWLGGTTPTGYTSEKVQEIIFDGKIKVSCKLEDNTEELKIIDIIVEKFLELYSISGVSKYLIKQGIKSRTGKYYSPLGIKQILQNPVYCIADKDARDYFIANQADVCFEEKDCSGKLGLLVYNKRDYRKKNAPRQSMDKWIVAIGQHKGRVSGKKWVNIQSIIENNIPTGKGSAKIHNEYSLLSGLIYCEKCGSRMFAKQRSNKTKNSLVFDYICNNKMRGGIQLCNCQNINGRQTDDMIFQSIIQYINENKGIYQLLEKLKYELKKQYKEEPAVIIENKIKKCNKQIDNLIYILSQDKLEYISIEEINNKIAQLDKQLCILTKEYNKIETNIDIINNQKIETNMLVNTLSNLKNNTSEWSIVEKRVLIKLVVRKIIWDEKNIHIFINEK